MTLQKPGFGAKLVRLAWTPDRAPLPVPAALRRPARLRLAQVGARRVRRPSSASIRSSPTSSTSGGTGCRRSSFAASAGSTSTGPGPRCRSRPTATTPGPASTWNRFGYANPLLHQYVEAPERSGLYYFRARTAQGAEFAFPWIVAPRQPTAPIAVLASNITWNAYNNFGGRSNYINPDSLPPTPTVNARLELKRYTDPEGIAYDTDDYAPLSFDRPEPINHIDDARGDHRPDRGPRRVPPRAGRVAAPRLARARAVRLRLLRRDPAPRRHPRPRPVPGPDPLDPPGILVARDVLQGQGLGRSSRAEAAVPGGQRAQLRGRVRRPDPPWSTGTATPGP